MASLVKQKLQSVTNGGSHADATTEAEKYKLLVTAGPSYDSSEHQIVHVNSDQALFVENQFVRAKINVRVRGFKGLPTSTPTSSIYFEDPIHEKDQYSIGFSFVPKQDLESVDTVWGNDFDHPIRKKLPPGFNTAFKIVKEFIDPGLECDAYADEPWLYGPSLSCWFAFRIGDKIGESDDFPAPQDTDVLKEGGDGEGEEIRHKLNLPGTGDKRRKYFLSAAHREAFTFEKGRVYQGDFYNPYIDFPNFSLKLPGFTMRVVKYVGQESHCLRYVFKNRSTGDVYFNVNFRLLWGEQLQEALEKDKEQREHEQAHDGEEPLATIFGGITHPGEHPVAGVNGTALARASQTAGSGECARPDEDAKSDPKYVADARTAGTATSAHDSDTSAHSDVRNERPAQMQLHPGDHDAPAAEYRSSHDVITRMLRETSTSDKSNERINVLAAADDVD
jgi:hypothetical protein